MPRMGKRAREVIGLPFAQMTERVGEELQRAYEEGKVAKEQELRMEIANLKRELRGVQIELEQANDAIKAVLEKTGALSLTALCVEFDGTREVLARLTDSPAETPQTSL